MSRRTQTITVELPPGRTLEAGYNVDLVGGAARMKIVDAEPVKVVGRFKYLVYVAIDADDFGASARRDAMRERIMDALSTNNFPFVNVAERNLFVDVLDGPTPL